MMNGILFILGDQGMCSLQLPFHNLLQALTRILQIGMSSGGLSQECPQAMTTSEGGRRRQSSLGIS